MNTLREVRDEDAPRILEWRKLPEVAQYMYTDHRITPQEHERWFNRVRHDTTCHYWIIVHDQEDVGVANITNIDVGNRRCYWAFYLASPSVRGKGLGAWVEWSVLQHVFDELSMEKLCCEVLAFNESVIKMHEKFGFQREGLFRQHVAKQGQRHDVVCLGMLRHEWLANKPLMEERLRSKKLL